MIGDMNEKAARPIHSPMTPMEVPVRIKRGEEWVAVGFHELTDEDLLQFVKDADPDEGWRWARSIAWLLAGKPARQWQPRPLIPGATSRPEGS